VTTAPRPVGRRPGTSQTRQLILDTARRLFAELGYDRTTLRGIAAAAEVDVALVSHFFSGKQRLFAEAAALPYDPAVVLARLLSGPREQIGRRLAAQVLDLLEDPATRRQMIALIRAAASEEEAAEQIRKRINRELLVPLATGLGSPDAPLRAALTGSQVVGLVMTRHIVGIEPLARTSREQLVAAIAPTLQRYLTGPIDDA
jgi:AcrR family transcriptional regulator